MHPKSNPDYYKMKKGDRILSLSGVPISYLRKNIDPTQFMFYQTSYAVPSYGQPTNGNVIILQPQSQLQMYQEVCSSISKLGGSGLYVIGSSPTEQSSYNLATYFTRLYYNTKIEEKTIPDIKWMDLGKPDWGYLKSDENPDLFVLHGINEDSEQRRIELAKDFLRRSDYSTKFLLVTSSNTLGFVMGKMKISPDIVWQMGRTVHRKVG